MWRRLHPRPAPPPKRQRHDDVIGVIWFEVDREIDWRIGDAPDAAGAFGDGARDARFHAPWSPYTRPLRLHARGLAVTGAGRRLTW